METHLVRRNKGRCNLARENGVAAVLRVRDRLNAICETRLQTGEHLLQNSRISGRLGAADNSSIAFRFEARIINGRRRSRKFEFVHFHHQINVYDFDRRASDIYVLKISE